MKLGQVQPIAAEHWIGQKRSVFILLLLILLFVTEIRLSIFVLFSANANAINHLYRYIYISFQKPKLCTPIPYTIHAFYIIQILHIYKIMLMCWADTRCDTSWTEHRTDRGKKQFCICFRFLNIFFWILYCSYYYLYGFSYKYFICLNFFTNLIWSNLRH